jgi:alanyl-tRNA synthetase
LLKAPKTPVKAVESLIRKADDLEKENKALMQERAKHIKTELINAIEEINGIKFVARKVDLDPASVKDLSFQMRNEVSPLFMVLATAENSKATISVALSDELVTDGRFNSGKMVKELAKYIQGGGGGQPFFATAGGKNPEGIPEALKKAEEILRQG